MGGGHDLRPLDLPEDLQAGGAVDGGGLLQGLVHVAQGRHIQDDGLADGGGEQDHDDAPDGGAGVAQPVKAGGAEDLVQQAVVGVEHPLPHHGDRHRTGDHRQVEHAPEEGAHLAAHGVDGRAHPQRKGGDHRHRHHHDEDGVPQRADEGGVLDHLDVVAQAGKGRGRSVDAHVQETVHKAHAHGHQHKAHKEQQAGQHEQVGGDGLPPGQHPGRVGLVGFWCLRHVDSLLVRAYG